jgi:hypothetical protein
VGAGVAAWQELRRRGEHPDGDDNVSDSVKLAAIRDALDRGGVGVKAEVEIIAKPYEQIEELMQMQGGSRGAFRGEPESVTDAIDAAPSDEYALEMLTQSTDGPLDVEVIDADPIHTGRFRAWLRRRLRACFSGDTTTRRPHDLRSGHERGQGATHTASPATR